jgi:hypothetical protein
VEIGDGTTRVIKCSHKSCVKVDNISNLQPKPPSRVTNTCDNNNIVNEDLNDTPKTLPHHLHSALTAVGTVHFDKSMGKSHNIAGCSLLGPPET